MKQPTRKAQEPYALNVGIVYLRPCDRGRLLASLARLGLFVRESSAAEEAALRGADLGLIVADASPEHAQRALQLSGDGEIPLVALLRAGTPTEAFTGDLAGAFAEDELDSGLRRVIGPLAATVRRGRSAVEGTPTLGGLVVGRDLATLASAARWEALEPSEGRLIGALVESPGAPVEREVLATSSGLGTGELRATVRAIRRKISALGGDPHGLATVRGFGYLALP